MINLSTTVFGQTFKNPVIPAAGPNVGTGEKTRLAALGGAGGLVTKTVSLHPAVVPKPNMAKFRRDSMINAELWSELTLDDWLSNEYNIALAAAREFDLPLIASIGYSPEELASLGPLLMEKGIELIEFSIHHIGDESITEAAEALRKAVSIPIIAKLSPNIGQLGHTAQLLEPYVDGFACINSFGPTLSIDIETVESPLGSADGMGWLSGPAIKPIALQAVYEVSQATTKPVIGVGGVSNGKDVIEFIMAGASLVGVCTAAILKGPYVYGTIAEQAAQWLEDHGYTDIAEIKGLFVEKMKHRAVVSGEHLRVVVNNDKCKACGRCEIVCQYDALTAKPKEKAFINQANCAVCGLCRTVCPFDAIDLVVG
ncbi:MAG: 4Fe-4S binding protein [Anaerolineaceae bacterium]|nr:4Fe-4S binding protein [Anaerolineaceae bacterium]